MNQNDIVTFYDKDNNIKKCIVLAFFQNNDNEYIIYKDINNQRNDYDILASRIIRNGDNILLNELNEEEWDYVEKNYTNLLKKINF